MLEPTLAFLPEPKVAAAPLATLVTLPSAVVTQGQPPPLALGVSRAALEPVTPFQTSWVPAALVVAAAVALARRSPTSKSRRSKSIITCNARRVATSPDDVIPWQERLSQARIETGIGMWAEKLNMTTIFDDSNVAKAIPATILVIKRGGNIVTDKKWPERHGYYAVQVGYDRFVPEDDWGRRYAGRMTTKGLPPLKKLKEFTVRPKDWEKVEIGDKLWPSDLFKEGDLVDIHGRTRGKGFLGAIRRWGHKRGPMSHGSKFHRHRGSMGAGTDPGRTLPGTKTASWGGDQACTVKKAKILKIMDRIDEDNMPESMIVIEGSVPGYSAHWESGGSYVYLNPAKSQADGRFKRDPVWLWAVKRGEDVDPYVPIPGQAWTIKTKYGRDIRWYKHEEKKYWPDGFPGYNVETNPFYDDCDPRLAIKAPEW